MTATDMVHDEINKACTSLLESVAQADNNIVSDIDRHKHNLTNDIKELVKGRLDEMGNVIADCFSIPPNVTLSTDQMKLRSMNENELQLQKELDKCVEHFMMVVLLCCGVSN